MVTFHSHFNDFLTFADVSLQHSGTASGVAAAPTTTRMATTMEEDHLLKKAKDHPPDLPPDLPPDHPPDHLQMLLRLLEQIPPQEDLLATLPLPAEV